MNWINTRIKCKLELTFYNNMVLYKCNKDKGSNKHGKLNRRTKKAF